MSGDSAELMQTMLVASPTTNLLPIKAGTQAVFQNIWQKHIAYKWKNVQFSTAQLVLPFTYPRPLQACYAGKSSC